MSRWLCGVALLAVVAALASCDGDGSATPPASTTPSPATATSTAGPSTPTPTATLLTPAQTEMPRDEGGSWTPRGLIAGSDQLLVHYGPRAASREERRQESGRVGLMPLAGGPIRELHTTAPGDQIGTRANDGRYLAWVEVGVFGVKPLDWRLFAVDTADPDGKAREVDFGGQPDEWGSAEGPPIALSGGRLAYARYVAEGSDWRNELVLVDLASGSAKTVSTGSVSTDGHITAVVIDGDTLIWARRKFAPSPQEQRQGTWLHELSLSTGAETRSDVQESLFEIASEGGTLVATTAGRVLMRRPGGKFENIFYSPSIPMGLAVAGGRAYWVDTGTNRPVFARLAAPAPTEFDTAYTLLVFTDGKTLTWGTRAEIVAGQPARHFIKWMPVPP